MEILKGILLNDLRKGDTISRYGPAQFALLLPSANLKTGTMILERIKSAFYRTAQIPNFVFSYKIKLLTYDLKQNHA